MASDRDFATEYVNVPASSATLALGVALVGSLLERIVVNVTTSGATGTVSIKDGANTAIIIVPASTPVGVYSVIVGARSAVGAWQITTGAGANAVAIGRFSQV